MGTEAVLSRARSRAPNTLRLAAAGMLVASCNGLSSPSSDAGPGPDAAPGHTDRSGAAGENTASSAAAASAGRTAERDAGHSVTDSGRDDADSGTGPAWTGPTLESASRDYRSWKQRSAEPQSISSEILSLCRLPTSSEQMFADSEHGDGLYFMDWLNSGAQAGFTAQPFERGSAIVKEKLRSDSSGKLARIALGIMIKRDPGFDAARGDWEFGYWQEQDGLRSGAEAAAHCGGCHARSKTDFVFVDPSWRQ
jgi:hypothetical protein